MQYKKISFFALIGAFIVGALILKETGRKEAPGQKAEEPPAQRASAFVPPFYADVRGVQIPRVLPPDRFAVPKTRESYRVAAAIPEALMQLPCYCWCDRIDHKSLLDCFVDEHAEYCGICQDSALWAHRRLKENVSIAAIRQEVVDHYAGDYGDR